MRKPVIDYRKLTPKKLFTSEYCHLLFIIWWMIYFALFFVVEKIVPFEKCTVIYSPLDDLIPFCEWFVIPYVGWYALIFLSSLYFMFYNIKNFKRLQFFIMTAQIISLVIYIIFPNRQDLRPDQFMRENLFTDIVAWLYSADTSTNVCPSMHVSFSVGIASVWLKEKSVSGFTKGLLTAFCILVCLSTVFIKQHSILDGIAAIPVCILAEFISCSDFWKEKLTDTKSR